MSKKLRIIRRNSSLKGYIGSFEHLSQRLGLGFEECRLVRLSIYHMYREGLSLDEVVSDMVGRGYDGSVVKEEYCRCVEIYDEVVMSLRGSRVTLRDVWDRVMDRVMCVGGVMGEMSKDEIVSVLSGLILDGRTDIRSKLGAIDLLGKYRDYYKSVDRDVRVIIEHVGHGVNVGVSGIPNGVEVHGVSSKDNGGALDG